MLTTDELLEIRERCLRATRNDQLWEAYAIRLSPFKIGPTVESHSRKSVRGEAEAAFREQDKL